MVGLRASSGQPARTLDWVLALSSGFIIAGMIRLGLLWIKIERRYVEFRGERLFLAEGGVTAKRRLIEWSFSPDVVEPRYTRLLLVYKFGRGRKRWRMLLDDDRQISELKRSLEEQFPQEKAA